MIEVKMSDFGRHCVTGTSWVYPIERVATIEVKLVWGR